MISTLKNISIDKIMYWNNYIIYDVRIQGPEETDNLNALYTKGDKIFQNSESNLATF